MEPAAPIASLRQLTHRAVSYILPDKVISTDVMECLEEEKEPVRMNLAPISETAEPYIMAPFVYLTMSAHASNLILLPGE